MEETFLEEKVKQKAILKPDPPTQKKLWNFPWKIAKNLTPLI